MEMNMINDSTLENVTGGDMVIGDTLFSNPVGKYSGVIGFYYYFVSNDGTWWWHGKLVDSFEERDGLFTTLRVHCVDVDKENGVPAALGVCRFFGDEVTIYCNIYMAE